MLSGDYLFISRGIVNYRFRVKYFWEFLAVIKRQY